MLIKHELGGTHPDIHAVRRHIKRQVAYDPYAALVHPLEDGAPLPEKDELFKAVVVHLAGVLLARLGERLALAAGEPALPLPPLGAALSRQRHEQGVVLQPVLLLLCEFFHFFAQSGG